jgi:hypothetical protein
LLVFVHQPNQIFSISRVRGAAGWLREEPVGQELVDVPNLFSVYYEVIEHASMDITYF